MLFKAGKYNPSTNRLSSNSQAFFEMSCETFKIRRNTICMIDQVDPSTLIIFSPGKSSDDIIKIISMHIDMTILKSSEKISKKSDGLLSCIVNESFDFVSGIIQETKPNFVIIIPDTLYVSGFQMLFAKHFLNRFEKPLKGDEGFSVLIDTRSNTFENASLFPPKHLST